MSKYRTISKPTLLIDKKKVLANIDFMLQKARKHRVDLQPHFKTHQSLEIGQLMLECGITKITVSSIQMAKKFAEQGYTEISVAFPLNRLEIDDINDLSQKTALNLTVLSTDAVDFLDQNLTQPVGIIMKIDTGYHRTGLHPNDSTIEKIIKTVQRSKNMKIHSFMAHTGHNYQAENSDIIIKNHNKTIEILDGLKAKYGLKYSTGDTPGCTLADNFGKADIIRPGNFVYYDLMQNRLSVCDLNKIAVSVACPVVAKHPDRNEIIIYGGAVHFSKEYIENSDDTKLYGQVISSGENSLDSPEPFLSKLSQEHGTLKCSDKFISEVSEGDIIKITPVHSCLTANLLGSDFLIY